MIRLDASTVLLQWAVGGLFFSWFTIRSNEIGKGYATMLRISFAVIAGGGAAAGLLLEPQLFRDSVAIAVAVVAAVGLFYRPRGIDLVAVAIGLSGLVVAAIDAGGNEVVSLIRILVGAAFLGAVTDAMLLGHWYLVQPGMPRKLLNDLVKVVLWILPFEVGDCDTTAVHEKVGATNDTTGGEDLLTSEGGGTVGTLNNCLALNFGSNSLVN